MRKVYEERRNTLTKSIANRCNDLLASIQIDCCLSGGIGIVLYSLERDPNPVTVRKALLSAGA
jgi:hypothetical protein